MQSVTAKKLRELADKIEAPFSRFCVGGGMLREIAKQIEEDTDNLIADVEFAGATQRCSECGAHRKSDELSNDLPERYCDTCAEIVRREYQEEAETRSFLNVVER